MSRTRIGIDEYELEYDHWDPYVAAGLEVAYSDRLAEDLLPVIYDPRGCGREPFPPELIAYRFVVDQSLQKMCALYEVYWRRQNCTWRELNKDHDHDYEQIQVHLNMVSGAVERVVVSSVGSVEYGGHGVEIYADVPRARAEDVEYITSPIGMFPWGGSIGRECVTQVRRIPLERLVFEDCRPSVVVLNCYHVFTGLKRRDPPRDWIKLEPHLERLDRKRLETWYYLHRENRLGHDVSRPLEEPCILYYPPPGAWTTRLIYRLLSLYFSIKQILRRRKV